MTSSWPEEPGYHWVTHNDNATIHLRHAAGALAQHPPDSATAQVHATMAQVEATLVVVHTLRDVIGKLHEQMMEMAYLRQLLSGAPRTLDEPHPDDFNPREEFSHLIPPDTEPPEGD